MAKDWFARLKWYLFIRKKPAVIVNHKHSSVLPAREENRVSEIHAPLTMYYGDSIDITWSIRVKYNAQAGIIEIWNGNQYAGILSSQENYESVHFLCIEYKKG